jgi:type III secretory pathway component EscV
VSREQEKRLRAHIDQWAMLIMSMVCIVAAWILPPGYPSKVFAILAIGLIFWSIACGRKARMPKDKEEPHA